MPICKYCLKNKAIENSHIIPSFIYEWLKLTSVTPCIRSTDNPNQRQQDGPKKALLCKDCELLFSKFENDFKTQIFNKVANYRNPCPDKLNFSKNTIKCIYSIAWRVLADTYYFGKDHQYTEDEFCKIPEFLKNIRAMIEDGKDFGYKIQFVPCTKHLIQKLGLPKIDFSYYERSISGEGRIWDNWERFFIYIKIPFSIIIF